MKGYIHSVESFGTVDGPGIRYVVFMQGCPLRCQYCHNPDTWQTNIGKEVSVDELLAEYHNNRSFYQKGGITVTGGEPLLQIDFVTKLLRKAKEKNIHTCIDTSGIVFNPDNQTLKQKFDELVKYTDLVMLDIKHIDSEKHKQLTGADNKNVLAFAKYLDEHNVPIWIRHVAINGITSENNDLFALGEFIGRLKTLKALDVLPYHTMGIHKYSELGLEYPLHGIGPSTTKDAENAKKIILNGIRNVRK